MRKRGISSQFPIDSIEDIFTEDQLPGTVIGRRNAEGRIRDGVDVEGRIGIDHGALRIQPLVQPGWGRSGLSYGPFKRQAGLAFAVSILNGHNASQVDGIGVSLRRRFRHWAEGTKSDTLPGRLYSWMLYPRKRILAFHLRRWIWLVQHRQNLPNLRDNLAIGWFPSEAVADPTQEGEAFIVRSAGPENGELHASVSGKALPVFRGLQNIPVYYVVLLRKQGAAYYAASMPGSRGLAGFPCMRPLAIDSLNDDQELYAGIYQGALGERGFRVDTRVYGVKVAELPDYSKWYGTAHAADRLSGQGPLHGSMADAGGYWRLPDGTFTRSPKGAMPDAGSSLALLSPGKPSGLIHARLGTADRLPAEVALVWRYLDPGNYWRLSLGSEGSHLSLWKEGRQELVAASETRPRQDGPGSAVQILDDGDEIGIYLDGDLLFNRLFQDARHQEACDVGFQASGSTDAFPIHSFEAHPRNLPVPDPLLLPFPQFELGDREIIRDEFIGNSGDLDTRVPLWRKTIGKGVFEQTGEAVYARGSVNEPHPGRTAYTTAWDGSHYADLQVEITAPGSGRGQGEKGRSGLILMQDKRNYLLVNCWLEDAFAGGTSISSFLTVDGFEDIFDAVWTNVGTRLNWGQPFELRVVFDMGVYTVFVNEEPVLYRALKDIYPDAAPFSIQKVGIATNYEWGADTGSLFRNFIARGRGESAFRPS